MSADQTVERICTAVRGRNNTILKRLYIEEHTT